MLNLFKVAKFKFMYQPKQYDAILQHAATNGNAEIIQIALKCGASIEAGIAAEIGLSRRYSSHAAFLLAAENQHIYAMRKLLDGGADIHAENDAAFNFAIHNNHIDVAKFLIENGVDVNQHRGEALREAVEKGYSQLVSTLIGAGADIYARDGSILHLAVEKGHLDIVRQLISAARETDNKKQTYIDNALRAAVKGGQLKTATILISNGADVGAYEGELLKIAAGNGQNDLVHLLIKAGAPIDVQSQNYNSPMTALRHAVKNNHLETATILLEAGAKDFPLTTAIAKANIPMISLLFKHGCNTHKKNGHALRTAAKHGLIDIAVILLNAGAHHGDTKEDSALIAAAESGSIPIVKLLIAANTNVYVANDGAINTAARLGHIDIVKLLLEAGSKPPKPDESKSGRGSRERYRDIFETSSARQLRERLCEEAKRQEKEEKLKEEMERMRQENERLRNISDETLRQHIKMSNIRSSGRSRGYSR